MTGHREVHWPTLDLNVWRDRVTKRWTADGGEVAILRDPPMVHAIGTRAFDPVAELLADRRTDLPERFELRVGPAAAGIVARTHRITMIGPMHRLIAGPPRLPEPEGLRALRPADADAVTQLSDSDHDLDPSWLKGPGWIGVEDHGSLTGAIGPIREGGGITLLSPPRLARRARRTDLAAQLCAAAIRRYPGAVLDVRMDRRARVAWAVEAGFQIVGAWERWWAEAR